MGNADVRILFWDEGAGNGYIGFVSYTKDRFWITTSFSPYSIQKYNLDFHNKHCYYNHQSLD